MRHKWYLILLGLAIGLHGYSATQQPEIKTRTFVAHENALPKGKAAKWIPKKQARLFKIVDDENAKDGKALQVYVASRTLQKEDIPILKIVIPDLPVGLYKVTGRIKISGMLNCIGTAIRFSSKGPSSPQLKGNNRVWTRYYEPTLHSYHFKEEDVYQEFSYLAEVIEPDPVTDRPQRPGITRAGYTKLLSKADHEKWRKIWKAGGSVAVEEQKEVEQERAKQREALLKQGKWDKGKLEIDLTLLQTINKGFGKNHNTLRNIMVDWIKVEPVKEPDHIVVRQVLPQKVWIRPGADQVFHVWCHNRSGKDQNGKLKLQVVHGLDTKIDVCEKDISLKNGAYEVIDIPWKAPKDKNLWGCQVNAELIKNGKAVSSASDVFTVQKNPWAVMNFGGPGRNRNPYYSPPHYQSWMEMYGISYRDGLAPWPDKPEIPYISGMSERGTQTSVDMQRRAVEKNHAIGVASFMYIQPMNGTGQEAEKVYLKHPEWFPGPIKWTDQIHDNWDKWEKDMLDRWHAGKEPISYSDKGLIHIEAPLNHAVDGIHLNMRKGAIKAVEYVGWDGIRWDGDFGCKDTCHMNIKFGAGSKKGNQEMSARRSREFKKEMRKVVPLYTESANIGEPTGVYDRKQPCPPPEDSKFHQAFLADGSSVMDEGWMNAYTFVDPRSIIRDYLWGARQCVDWCRKLGGYWYGFCPDRDSCPYFSQSIIYYHLLVPLAGGLGNYCPHICTPYSETGEAHFFMRFSEFFFDLKLKPLKDAEDKIRVDSPNEMWFEDSAVWRDLPDGRRRYVIPLINPPTIERFFRDRFSELPETVREPFPVEITIPEGFTDAKVWMLTSEPKTAAVPLKAELDGDLVIFDVPELLLYRVLVVEFQR